MSIHKKEGNPEQHLIISKSKEEQPMNKQTQKMIIVAVMVTLCLAMFACSTAPISQSQEDTHKDSIRAMTQQTLASLYKAEPAAKSAVAGAAGYAVFSDFGFKVMFLGGAHGKGMAVGNAKKQETFMKMTELQPGLGVGAEKFRLVLIFENPKAYNQFVTSGWELGANAMAAAKSGKAGGGAIGAVSFSEGVKMYQLSETGAIVGVSITGAKYSKDKDLN
jgi:lipid-binding SYLF domain-containing protein